MDPVIGSAARLLARGDVLAALNLVALRDDAASLALRGIAMAQLGDLARARQLLRQAHASFGPGEVVHRARTALAIAELALVTRELSWPTVELQRARESLERAGDVVNATHATHLEARRCLLLGRLDEAEQLLAATLPRVSPPALVAAHHLLLAGIAARRIDVKKARAAFRLARRAAVRAGIEGLVAEVEGAASSFERQSLRVISRGAERTSAVDELEVVLKSDALVVDACRGAALHRGKSLRLAKRPVLFALLRVLAEAWPDGAPREVLLARAFGVRTVGESHRVRLRVEVGRLRAALKAFAGVEATARGFRLVPRVGGDVVVLAPAVETPHANLLALLADGEAWSSSALALVLETSARTIQRALEALHDEGLVQALGSGRARRWIAPSSFPTLLLLPGPLPGS